MLAGSSSFLKDLIFMAQSQTYFGLRRGSTKTQTFSILNGKQITKDRQIGGRNPRTPEMMTQRMVMATASAAYAQMKQIVDHSFEGITYGAHTMSEFIRVNAEALRDNINQAADNFAYNPYRDRAMYPGAYIMSRGTASPIPISGGSLPTGIQVTINGATERGPQIYIQLDEDETTVTADKVMALLGCRVGDMATICLLFSDRLHDGYSFGFLRCRFLKGGSATLTNANLSDYILFESSHGTDVSVGSNNIGIHVLVPSFANDVPGAFCCIHSLKAASGWLRSSATMQFEKRIDISPVAESALATYPLGPSYVLNGGDV